MDSTEIRTRPAVSPSKKAATVVGILAIAILRKKLKNLGIAENSTYSGDISAASGE